MSWRRSCPNAAGQCRERRHDRVSSLFGNEVFGRWRLLGKGSSAQPRIDGGCPSAHAPTRSLWHWFDFFAARRRRAGANA
jgi:hypothetical protein